MHWHLLGRKIQNMISEVKFHVEPNPDVRKTQTFTDNKNCTKYEVRVWNFYNSNHGWSCKLSYTDFQWIFGIFLTSALGWAYNFTTEVIFKNFLMDVSAFKLK